MDRRSWLWRRKSSEKSPGESESSTSSQHSERYSDDQETLRASPNSNSPNHAQSTNVSSKIGRASPNNNSPNYAQSQDVSSKIGDNEVHEPNKKHDEVHETVKSLSEKLSAALLNISAKEDLVKQHSKVAEEAVSGWEKAEKELAVMKQQLEVTSHKNSLLEDKISHLDGALKECVRQLRQSREEQEQKIHDALIKKTSEWESEKSELDNQLVLLKEQLENAKSEPATTIVDDLQSRIEAAEKEKAVLKANLVAVTEELKVRTLEWEFSTQTAETASKQHLESIKRVAKLEAECRRLKAAARKTCSANDHKAISSSSYMESVTDSQSDNGDRLLGMENEASCSDSWATALVAELDQFRRENTRTRNNTTSVDIDIMDDFLEMERLAGLPEADRGSSSCGLEVDSTGVTTKASPSKVEVMNQKTSEFEAKFKKIEDEKAKVEMALAETRNQFETSRNELIVAEGRLFKLQKELDMANESKQAAISEAVTGEAKRRALESQLESAQLEINKLKDKVASLVGKVKESALSSDLKSKLEVLEKTRATLESQLQSSYVQVDKLQDKVVLLEGRVEEERALSAEFAVKLEAADSIRNTMKSRLLISDLEINTLQEKVGLLERRIEEERSQSAEFAAKLETVEAERKLLEFQLESTRLEVGKLQAKVDLLEGKIDEERALSAKFAAKCQNLEDELLRKRQEADVRHISSSNGDLKVKQEKELALAAGKLAECQKTIASLGRQLKALATIDDFMLETGKVHQLNFYLPDLREADPSEEDMGSCNLPNGKAKDSPPSSVPSSTAQSGRK
ncbi:filament-like plant protein 1 [Iris pallida]|uniref:Filament-like plant protein 1 n=1 Tax=Iris pallida TaxID=29817 RepID=A0AAX6GBE1_IRIPA|nr:filament-like plant protein 1 [Iris pallida]